MFDVSFVGIIKTVRFSEDEWLALTVIDRYPPLPPSARTGWVSNEDGPNFLL